MKKSGYAFVCISNEGDQLVYFDNLLLTHERGRILEESHYYPFGLKQSGVSSRSLNSNCPLNRRFFNGGNELQYMEFSDGSGLDLYDATFRQYDAQLGRFNQVDPLSEIANDWSPYNFAVNNPLLYNDPLGLFPKQNVYSNDEEENERKRNHEPGYIAGWVRDPNGKVYFDPKAHDQTTAKAGDTYLSEEIIIVDNTGDPVGFGNDQGGMSFNVTLPAVAIKGKNPNAWALGLRWYEPIDRISTAFGFVNGEGIRYSKWWWADANWKFKPTSLLKRQANGKFVVGVQGYRNGYASAISKAKLWNKIGTAGSVASGVISLVDMGINGVNAQNTVDLIVAAVSLAPGFGWIVGGGYLLANLVSEAINGKSLVENLTGNEYD